MPVIRVAIAGLGAIGRVLARKLADGIPGLVLAGAAARDTAKAQAWLDAERIACPLVEPEAFPTLADLAIECAPAPVLERICRPMLEAGKQVMVLSAGALLPRPELVELARTRGGQIIVPTGALLGLDAVTAAAEGRIHSVRMITRKPPGGLAGAPYLEANGISVEGLKAPKRVFAGTARDGAAGFPANVNVAAALSLAVTLMCQLPSSSFRMVRFVALSSTTSTCRSLRLDGDGRCGAGSECRPKRVLN